MRWFCWLALLVSVQLNFYASFNSSNSGPVLSPSAYSTPAASIQAPWLAGPLLAPTGEITPYGYIGIEAYSYCTFNTGMYNTNWTATPFPNKFFSFENQYYFYFGLTPWMDITFVPQFFVNSTRGKTNAGFGDFTAGFEFQLYPASSPSLFPGIKFSVEEVFPTGVYQNLHPDQFNTDRSGAGAYGTYLNLVFYKVYYLSGSHFMSATASASYQINSPIHVHGLNAYGGGAGTNGKVVGGHIFEAIVSFEFTFNQNWVFAIDNVYSHTMKTKFSGKAGILPNGAPAAVGGPSTEQFSFAPAIEYNFSKSIGLVGGCWFTAAGRNSLQFASGIIEFVYFN